MIYHVDVIYKFFENWEEYVEVITTIVNKLKAEKLDGVLLVFS